VIYWIRYRAKKELQSISSNVASESSSWVCYESEQDADRDRVLKKEIGCSKVIAWNSVCRRNEPDKVQLKHVERQQAPEKGFIPSSRLQPIASFAHVDLDSVSLHVFGR
jgi:hypothetical protein